MKRINIAFLLIPVLIFAASLGACSMPGQPGIPAGSPSGAQTPNGSPAAGDLTDGNLKSNVISVEETVLLDRGGIKITLKSFSAEELFGPTFKVQIENNTSKNVTVQLRDSSVNGVMADTIFSSDVAAGMKANEEITVVQSDLDIAGIEVIKDFEFKFHVFDAQTLDTVFDSDIIRITTSADPSYVQEYNSSGIVILDEKGIKVTVQKMSSEDSFWGADVYVFIENNTEGDITVQGRDVSVNGFMIDPMFSSDVAAGKKAYDTITFLESDLEDNGITSVEEITLSLIVFSADTLKTIIETQPSTVTFGQ